ncbi:MAG: phosphoribosylformylglycinamidine synthase subunit PurQ [Deltaproteobacteria bacterium]|jgi:phosphoribosylformylglycinamidine synthase I|nr:phosphoribosylformylglycinamidine synthase subunit PurQ [Deltaproteobacteria bacterium]
MKIGILRFPGTNCDYDIVEMVKAKSMTPVWLWHQDQFDPQSVDRVIVPGGFSYGDYLRCGALAAKSEVMKSVFEFAKKGRPILGICNGFQILCETGLLPGVLLRNQNLKFIDKWVDLQEENQNPYFNPKSSKKDIRLPIAHGEGRFYISREELKKIQDQNQIWLRYKEDINGSTERIAGIMNLEKNICALMPHPERALWDWMGGQDGFNFL